MSNATARTTQGAAAAFDPKGKPALAVQPPALETLAFRRALTVNNHHNQERTRQARIRWRRTPEHSRRRNSDTQRHMPLQKPGYSRFRT